MNSMCQNEKETVDRKLTFSRCHSSRSTENSSANDNHEDQPQDAVPRNDRESGADVSIGDVVPRSSSTTALHNGNYDDGARSSHTRSPSSSSTGGNSIVRTTEIVVENIDEKNGSGEMLDYVESPVTATATAARVIRESVGREVDLGAGVGEVVVMGKEKGGVQV
ncbi:hypothetical protein DM02DRAFT_255361 [Periconia macrospinosa]|uniref:Uncharacterized protein n=1 Tax=Periconia macrospinosa TaxID=97972 RepID=A0A2V1DZM7_9PLEO|nr:hypothetical protein DM02DRAFT_255361 [Periconia macrospinosa]